MFILMVTEKKQIINKLRLALNIWGLIFTKAETSLCLTMEI